jgi:hypothetical protein
MGAAAENKKTPGKNQESRKYRAEESIFSVRAS